MVPWTCPQAGRGDQESADISKQAATSVWAEGHEQRESLYYLGLLVVRASLIAQLGWEDPLEKGKATHSSILAWRVPWTV